MTAALAVAALLLLSGTADAARMCMPCPAGKWGTDGKCEQDCEAGHYCVGGSKIACPAETYNGEAGGKGSEACRPCRIGNAVLCPAGSVSDGSKDKTCAVNRFMSLAEAGGCYGGRGSWHIVDTIMGSGTHEGGLEAGQIYMLAYHAHNSYQVLSFIVDRDAGYRLFHYSNNIGLDVDLARSSGVNQLSFTSNYVKGIVSQVPGIGYPDDINIKDTANLYVLKP
jgi:hypothetical protein